LENAGHGTSIAVEDLSGDVECFVGFRKLGSAIVDGNIDSGEYCAFSNLQYGRLCLVPNTWEVRRFEGHIVLSGRYAHKVIVAAIIGVSLTATAAVCGDRTTESIGQRFAI